jgi:hypothetical protein
MEELPTYDQLRHRIEREDELLNARAGVFLVLNGLTAVAAGVSQPAASRFLVCIVSAVINALWLLCSLKSRAVLKAVTVYMLKRFPEHPLEKIIQTALGPWQSIRPTTILSIYIPALVTLGWLVAVVIILA